MMSTGIDSISVSEAARILRADPPFVFALVLRGELRSVGTGSEIRLSKAAVQKYLATHPQVCAEVTRSETASVVWH
jgi:excisionase family DNA binding protein